MSEPNRTRSKKNGKPTQATLPGALVSTAWALAKELGSYQSTTDEPRRKAIDLALAGLAFVTGETAYGRESSAADIERAYAGLVGGVQTASDAGVLATIEEAVAMGRRKRGRLPWSEVAAALAGTLEQPAGIVPELARRLEGHYVATKQGHLPAGRFTTATIAAWLFAKRVAPKRSRAIGKRRK
jgi:hypothetical protein